MPKLPERVVACGLSLFAVAACTTISSLAASSSLVYIGTQQTADPGMGLLRARFDAEAGTLTKPEQVAQTKDPAFFVIHPSGRQLYVCNTGTPGGVSAFAIAPETGALTLLNHKPSPEPRGPSHVSLDRSGRFLFDANYGGGHVRIHALLEDGSIGEQTAFLQHTGSSVHPQRQTKAYAHWFATDPTNRFALAADLGLDQVLVYRFDAKSGKIVAHDPPHARVTPGSGPRHVAFHPNGKLIYVIEELANTVTAFSWDGARGTLGEFQTISTLPEDFTGTNTAAEIAVHANGRFLYASNRGHDSVAMFAVDEATGRLTLRQRVSAGGKTPRFFAFHPSYRWMLVGHQDGDGIAIFAVNETTGELRPHGDVVSVPRPFGIAFLPAP
jgi:6-phosphogluconolactonase